MRLKHVGSVLVAFAAGILVASVVHRGGIGTRASSEARVPAASEVSVDRLCAECEQEIATFKGHLEGGPLRVQNVGDVSSAALTLDDRLRIIQELRRGSVASYKKQETDRLLAAGFTAERIDWLNRRSEEIEADWIQTEDRLRQQGRSDYMATLAHAFDKDIGLRQELGDDEYARYRQALGRGVGLRVYEPIAGGIGERAGIRPGDEIIAYNGTRIFNQGELLPLVGQVMTSGTSVAVDVVRNGQAIRLTAESGDLRIRPVMNMASADEMAKAMGSSAAVRGVVKKADQAMADKVREFRQEP